MTQRFTSLILAIVLLACPFGCLAGATCCASGGVAEEHSCCEHCDRTSVPASSETPDDGPVEGCCTACCLCKGAVLGEAVPDLTPTTQALLPAPSHSTVAVNSLASLGNVQRTSVSDWYGDALRIEIGSFLC